MNKKCISLQTGGTPLSFNALWTFLQIYNVLSFVSTKFCRRLCRFANDPVMFLRYHGRFVEDPDRFVENPKKSPVDSNLGGYVEDPRSWLYYYYWDKSIKKIPDRIHTVNVSKIRTPDSLFYSAQWDEKGTCLHCLQFSYMPEPNLKQKIF